MDIITDFSDKLIETCMMDRGEFARYEVLDYPYQHAVSSRIHARDMRIDFISSNHGDRTPEVLVPTSEFKVKPFFEEPIESNKIAFVAHKAVRFGGIEAFFKRKKALGYSVETYTNISEILTEIVMAGYNKEKIFPLLPFSPRIISTTGDFINDFINAIQLIPHPIYSILVHPDRVEDILDIQLDIPHIGICSKMNKDLVALLPSADLVGLYYIRTIYDKPHFIEEFNGLIMEAGMVVNMHNIAFIELLPEH